MGRVRYFLLLSMVIVVAAACSSEKKRKGVDPLGTEEAFCQEWGKAACNSKVVEACAAKDAESCVSRQSSYCLGLVPSYYNSKNAKTCIAAVKTAYADAKLTIEELEVVRELGGECSQLNEGPLGLGESCTASDECNSLEGLECLKKSGEAQGTCQVPTVVGGGFSCTAPNETCDKDFYCDGNNCLARPKDNAVCSAEVPCNDAYQCLGATGDMHCAAKGGTAAACTDDSQCVSGICARPASAAGKCVESVVLSPTDPLCSQLG